jgi:hypothetical protein
VAIRCFARPSDIVRLTSLLAVAAVAAFAVPGTSSGSPARPITGAWYSFNASDGPASTSKGSGVLRKTGDFLAVVRGRRGSKTFASRVSLWAVDRRTPTTPPRTPPRTPKTTLVLTVRVTSSIGGCRTGVRGTVTLVDWNRALGNGRTSDRVSVRFPAGPCRVFSRAWSNGSGDRVRVAISLS